MKILVLDDDERRHDAFAKALVGDEVKHVWTFDEAVLALDTQDRFDLAYLDHDLNDFGKKSGYHNGYGFTEYTGFDVAAYMARHLAPEKQPLEVIVHSWNPPGARMMVNVLRDAGIKASYRPFHGAGGVLIEEDPIEGD
jgi:CheY-like chemotaxis protein